MTNTLAVPSRITPPELDAILREEDTPFAGTLARHLTKADTPLYLTPAFRQHIETAGNSNYNSIGLIHVTDKRILHDELSSIVGNTLVLMNTGEHFHVEQGYNEFRYGNLWLLTPLDKQDRVAEGTRRIDLYTMSTLSFETNFNAEHFR